MVANLGILRGHLDQMNMIVRTNKDSLAGYIFIHVQTNCHGWNYMLNSSFLSKSSIFSYADVVRKPHVHSYVRMYVYTYIHVCTYMYIYIHVYVYIYVNVHVYVHVDISIHRERDRERERVPRFPRYMSHMIHFHLRKFLCGCTG